MSTAGADIIPYVPNPFYSPADVSRTSTGTLLIDLSRDSPDPQSNMDAENFDDTVSENGSSIYVPDDEDYVPPPDPTPEVPRTVRNVTQRTLWLMNDVILRSNFGTLLGGTEPDGGYPRPSCYYHQLPNGWYALRPHYRKFFTERLVTCAGLIAAALNDRLVNDRGFIPERIPVSVPIAAMEQSKLHFPGILLFLSRGWTLPTREFVAEAEIVQHIENFFNVLRLGIATFAKIISTTMRNGQDSVCNPGAGIGMTKDEFIQRAGPATHTTNLIESWIDVLLDDVKYKCDTDFAASKIFALQPFTYFLLVNDGSTITLLPHRPAESLGDYFTHRIHITPAELGQQLAMCGF
ncbi:hypothetical protein GGX14DRAFT_567054 [Mycena pura]|nr:hypothetical protein GGX14DRAFT_567054 [Mycena pura]